MTTHTRDGVVKARFRLKYRTRDADRSAAHVFARLRGPLADSIEELDEFVVESLDDESR